MRRLTAGPPPSCGDRPARPAPPCVEPSALRQESGARSGGGRASRNTARERGGSAWCACASRAGSGVPCFWHTGAAPSLPMRSAALRRQRFLRSCQGLHLGRPARGSVARPWHAQRWLCNWAPWTPRAQPITASAPSYAGSVGCPVRSCPAHPRAARFGKAVAPARIPAGPGSISIAALCWRGRCPIS